MEKAGAWIESSILPAFEIDEQEGNIEQPNETSQLVVQVKCCGGFLMYFELVQYLTLAQLRPHTRETQVQSII